MKVIQSFWNLISVRFTKKVKKEQEQIEQHLDNDSMPIAEYDTMPIAEYDTIAVDEYNIILDNINIKDVGEDQESVLLDHFASKNGFNLKFFKAVVKVESSDCSFANYAGLGKYPKLKFDPYQFNMLIKDPKKYMPFTDSGKGYSTKTNETNYVAYKKALSINRKMAIKATTFGKFKIKGENYKKFEYKTPELFLESLKTLYGQYDAFVKHLHSNPKLLEILCKEEPNMDDFKTFALYYCGLGAAAYSKKLKKAYDSF